MRPQGESKKTGRIYLIAALLSLPVALLVLGGYGAAVPLIYFAICLAGAAVALSTVAAAQSISGALSDGSRSGNGDESGYTGVDRVEMFAESVRAASRGSPIARREVERTFARILEGSGKASNSAQRERRVVAVPLENDHLSRSQYLSALDRTLAGLERGMDRPVGE